MWGENNELQHLFTALDRAFSWSISKLIKLQKTKI